ncbi:ArsR family transcriptional regulator [Azospirillum sp. RWY-5-1]|uniref:ArsR family transcriptional regulator n=1 Tax=Azospirillum oleiclasticum TaxID=2735135 RepID=A0ABX2T8A6_9PROT|nr:ArsR family transcriptional regulator [Azospirillum oleiclasticum]NYZ12875.1 ArsR family transcriptional regulator [Azospirillum oleiclasticum]NYZ20035.1 ArsR family transcriptional regulator [Azospirillum oleiclasticum]
MSMNDQVRAVFDADRRLTALRLLDEGGGAANSATLEKAVRVFFAGIDRATANADARWLAAAGLVDTEELRPDLLSVRLTDRGERVARGLERVAGVSRPSRD